MNIIRGLTRNSLLTKSFAVVMFFAIGLNANAGFFDWFRGSDNGINSGTMSQMAFVTTDNLSNNVLDGQSASIVVADNFLKASNSPVKNSSVKNVSSKYCSIARELIVPISAYSSTPDQTDDSPFITANGAYVYDGLVAANFLPFGTKIKIPEYFGDKIFTVEDRMNKRYWQKVDVWFPDRESALHFGVRTLKIQILES